MPSHLRRPLGRSSSLAGMTEPCTADETPSLRRLLPALCLAVLLLAAAALPATASAARWKPKATTAPWQWQLQGKIDTSVKAPVYEVDGFDVPKATVGALHRKGRKVICYMDVGSAENYRPDFKQFPASVLGNKYDGYPDERWLDIRQIKVIAPILNKRFDLCKRKGFDAVEPDNMAGYQNNTGFPLTAADQLRFNRYIAKAVHTRGMSVALKNDPDQAKQLVGQFDFAVVEECFQYNECRRFSPFIAQNKAVFEAEYELNPSEYCAKATDLGFSSIRKSYDLFARPWIPC